MRWFVVVLLFFSSCSSLKKKYVISGTLKNYQGEVLNDGVVILKSNKFKDLVTVTTDHEGKFSLTANAGSYNALYAVKDYKVNYLEFWYWDLILDRNIELDIKIGGLEVYGLHAWRVYNGAFVYFRPMSLYKGKRVKWDINNPKNVSPKLSKGDIKVYIDGIETDLWSVQYLEEQIGSKTQQKMAAYILSVNDQRKNSKAKNGRNFVYI